MSHPTPHPHLEARAKRSLGKLQKSFPDRTVNALVAALRGATATYFPPIPHEGEEPEDDLVAGIQLDVDALYDELALMDPESNAYQQTKDDLNIECYNAA